MDLVDLLSIELMSHLSHVKQMLRTHDLILRRLIITRGRVHFNGDSNIQESLLAQSFEPVTINCILWSTQ